MVRAVDGGGVHLSWPMVGVMVALTISTVTGAIQLGGVQTHVLINTARLDLLEARDHDRVADIARIKARQEMNERRIDTIESTRPTTGELSGTSRATDARMTGLEERIKTLEAAPRAPALVPGR